MMLSQHQRVFSRRICLPLCLLIFTSPTIAHVKPGDSEWMPRFRIFIKAFNEFVEALDDNRLDRAKWARMRTVWDDLEVD